MASVRHLNLFPFCFEAKDSYFETSEKIKQYAVPIWWRVKTWKLYGSVLIQANNENEDTIELRKTAQEAVQFNVSDQTYGDGNTLKQISSEIDLICFKQDHSFVFQYGIETFAVNECEITIGPRFAADFYADDVTKVWSKKEGANVGKIRVIWLGEFFDVFMYRPDKIDAALYGIKEMDLILKADRYWPYDPKDGSGPIYNETTGAQIRSFPSN